MKYLKIVLFFSLACLFSCNNSELTQQLKSAQEELAATKEALTAAEAQLTSNEGDDAEKSLVHLVFLKLKEGSKENDRIAIKTLIKKLESINGVNDFQVAEFEDLGDDRAMSDYQIVISMSFKTEAYYNYYQGVDLHGRVRDAIAKYLAAPPLTYDYWTE